MQYARSLYSVSIIVQGTWKVRCQVEWKQMVTHMAARKFNLLCQSTPASIFDEISLTITYVSLVHKDYKNYGRTYRVFIKYCSFFPRIRESLLPLPRQHSAAIVCTKNYQSIGVTVHSHFVENFEGLLQRRYLRGRGCSELWKNTIFPEHPVYIYKCFMRFLYRCINGKMMA